MYVTNKKSPVMVLLLSFITCGIYMFFWLADTTAKTNMYLGDNTPSPTAVVLLSIFTCGIYTIYWYYVIGQKITRAEQQAGLYPTDNSILYLLFAIFGLSFVSLILVQSSLNKVWDSASTQQRATI